MVVMMTTSNLNNARVADLRMTMTGHVERGDIPGISPQATAVVIDFWTHAYRSLEA
jgi:hypothetical protein